MYKINLFLNLLIVMGFALVDYIVPYSNIEIFYIPVILLLPKMRSLIFKRSIKTDKVSEIFELLVNVYLLLIISRCLFDSSINFNNFQALVHPYIVVRLIVVIGLLLFMNLLLYKNKTNKDIKVPDVSDISFVYTSLVFAIGYFYFSVKYQNFFSPFIAFALSIILIFMIFNLIKRVKGEGNTILISFAIAILSCIIGNGILIIVFFRFAYLKYYKDKKIFY